MKNVSMLLLFLATMMIAGKPVFSQTTKADDIKGIWFNAEKDAKIEIYKSGSQFYGKIIWLKEPIDPETNKPKLDKLNPDVKLKNRPKLGLIIMNHFVFEDGEWNDGTIYDSKKGDTYKCTMKLGNSNTLNVRGYIGKSWMGLGKTTVWTRTK
jgi:uncharacterized protein (DUF2147 family)